MNMSISWIIIIIVFIKLLYVYSIQFNFPKCPKINLDKLEICAKTGDLLLFHATDNFNSTRMISYITHVGIIFRKNEKSKPLIFEAFDPMRMENRPSEFDNGIILANLTERCKTYRGLVYYEPLKYPVSPSANLEFEQFIKWAYENLYYMPNIIGNAFKKILLNDKFRYATQCGELTTMSLIKLNLLPESILNKNRKHHLRWVSNLTKLKNNEFLPRMLISRKYWIIPH